jgi:hypothetical protein
MMLLLILYPKGGGNKQAFDRSNNFTLVGTQGLKIAPTKGGVRDSLEGFPISPKNNVMMGVNHNGGNNNNKNNNEAAGGTSVMRNGNFQKLFRDSDDESMGVSATLDEEMTNVAERRFYEVGQTKNVQIAEGKNANPIKNLFSSVKKFF